MASPVIHYTFETGDGTNSGTTGSTHDLTIPNDFSIDTSGKRIGNKGLLAGPVDNVARNGGSGSYYTTLSNNWSMSQKFTIALWAKPSNNHAGTDQRIVSFSVDTASNNTALCYNTNNKLTIWGNSTNKYVDVPNQFDDRWHHYVFIFNETEIIVYVDTVLEGTVTGYPTYSNRSMVLLTLGAESGGGNPDSAKILNGYIDDFRIYDYALTASQIQSVIQHLNDPPIIHYTFDTDGTNTGSLGSTYDLTIPSLFSIDTNNQLSGSGCLKAIRSDGQDASQDPNTRFSFPLLTVPSVGFSMSFFIKYPDGYPSGIDPRLFDANFSNNLNYLSVHHQSSTSMRIFGAGSTNTAFTHSLSLFDGNYHNYVLVFSGMNKKLYIDGVLIEEDNTAAGDFSVGPTMNYFNIGSAANSNAAVCNGYMDQISLYDYPLSLSNVKSRIVTSGMTITQLLTLGISVSELLSEGITIAELLAEGITAAELLAEGVSQLDINIALITIKIHTAFTISDGTNSSTFATTDADYTPSTFAAKLTTDLGYAENMITLGIDTTSYYRMYLQFDNAVTLTGMPKYIFDIPFSDFSLKAGSQVNFRNVNLDADMTFNLTKPLIPQSQIGEDIVPTATESGTFGYSVAINANGTIVAISNHSYNNGKGRVVAYEYKIPTTTQWSTTDIVIKGTDTSQVTGKLYWTQRGSIIDSIPTENTFTGSVDLTNSGNILAVVSISESGQDGVLRVYEYINDDWSVIGSPIIAPNDEGNPQYGDKDLLRINGDGTVVCWGSKTSKKIRAYEYDGTTWNPLGSVIVPTNDVSEFSLSMNESGYIISASAKAWNSNLGEVRVFEFSNGSWSEIGVLTGISSGGKFGVSTGLNAAGDILAVGAERDDTGNTRGMIKVYQYTGSSGNWNTIGNIQGPVSGDKFGWRVELNPSGTVVVGTSTLHSSKRGLVRAYQYDGTTWNQLGSDILGDNNTGTGNHEFGWKLAMGNSAFITSNYIFSDPIHLARVIQLEEPAVSNTSTITAGNYFINDFVSKLDTDISNYSLSFDEPNKSITFGGVSTDISFSITSTDTTVFDTSITEITASANTLSFITYGQPELTSKDYINNGVTLSTYLSNGYTIPELYKEGVIVDWDFDTNANHLVQSYVKDFIDISGSLLLRNNSSLTVDGNIETNGNISINNRIMEADLSLNHNIFVGGDIYMNGNVTVGDLSMNGKVVDCSFTNSSIPTSAFNGTVGPDYSQQTIQYNKGVIINNDVSMNANVEINNLKVDGNIKFSDGTTMSTYDNNIEVNYNQSKQPGDYFDATVGGTLNPSLSGGDKGDQLFCSSDGRYAGLSFGGWNPDNHGDNGVANKQGLFITRDFGATWTHSHLPNPADGTPLYRRHVSFQMSSDGKYMICGVHANTTAQKGNDTVIGYSEDYGVTWTTYLSKDAVIGYSIDHYIAAVAINHDASFMTVSLSNPAKSWYSTDKMVTWTEFGQPEGQMMNTTRIVNNTVAISHHDARNYSMYKIESGVVISLGSYAATGTGSYQCVGAFSRGGPGSADTAFFTSRGNGNISKVTGLNTTPVLTDMSSIHTHNYYRLGVVMSPSGKYVLIGEGVLTLRSTFYTNKTCYLSTDYGDTFSTISSNFFNHTDLRSIAISDAGHFYGLDTTNKRIYYSTYTYFKASTFTSLTINNTLTAGSFSTSSDYRIKTDISQLDEKVTLDNLRPVKYLQTLINKPQYGLIAHELQEYYPDLVVGEKDGKEWQQVNYTGLIALLINEIKQLKRELNELENSM